MCDDHHLQVIMFIWLSLTFTRLFSTEVGSFTRRVLQCASVFATHVFNFVAEDTIRKDVESEEELKLNGLKQALL
jgi:hypothetical protein